MRTIYLGRWGSAAAQEAYDQIITDWLANDRHIPQAGPSIPLVKNVYTVGTLVADFMGWAMEYYKKSGHVTNAKDIESVQRYILKKITQELPTN